MRRNQAKICMGVVSLLLSWNMQAQEAGSGRSTVSSEGLRGAAVPRVTYFSGIVTDAAGKPQTGIVGVSFSLYEIPEGGVALWEETQNVQLDEQGRYSVFLGTMRPEGLPLNLFTSGKARWLGVQPQLSGIGEQPRILLVGVPYALKAADADTLGGIPASAFVLATAPGVSDAAGASAATAQPAVTPALAGSGTLDFIPLWTPDGNTLGNSILFQSGSLIGVGTQTPAATLDVAGQARVRGKLLLPAAGTSTASAGKNSQPLNIAASAFNSGTTTANNETFSWQAEPVGNNTASPSATLNLLFGAGTSIPAETGLHISSAGVYTFAPGQTFPGTGTLTGVTAGSGLTGGGTSGSVNLGLLSSCSTNQVLQWNGSTWVCATISGSGGGTITGVTAGTDLTGGGTTGNVTLNLNTTATDARYAQLGASNTFNAIRQWITGNSMYAAIGDPGCSTGFAGITFSTGLINCTNYALIGNGTNVYLNRPKGGALYFLENNYAQMTIVPGGGVQVPAANGMSTIIGDPGCNPGFAGITFSTGTRNCQAVSANYALIGDGTSIYLNRPTGGSIIFREGNTDEMTIAPGGSLTINSSSSYPGVLINSVSIGLHAVATGQDETGVEGDGGPGSTSVGGPGVVGLGGAGAGTPGGSGGTFYGGLGGPTSLGGDGIDAMSGNGGSAGSYAGNFVGNVYVSGFLSAGVKFFKIDHPLDPANKYLYHASVESSEMKNIYDGVAMLDANGEALVALPEWFETLNKDFRYQLTAVGAPGPNLYVAQEVQGNNFRIAGGRAGSKVSWQVTGIRQDPFANAHPLQVEVDKSERERGYYLHPELYGVPEEEGIDWARHPEAMKHMREMRVRQQAELNNGARSAH